jgi:hypothetical protein
MLLLHELEDRFLNFFQLGTSYLHRNNLESTLGGRGCSHVIRRPRAHPNRFTLFMCLQGKLRYNAEIITAALARQSVY